MSDIYLKRTQGLDSSEGIGVAPALCESWLGELETYVPLFPMTYVTKPRFAKLSAWYIIRGLRPTSPSTRIATERCRGLSRDRHHTHTAREPRTATVNIPAP